MAGITINTLSGNIEKIYGKSLYPIHKYVEDNAKVDTYDKITLKKLFNVEDSKNFAESNIGMTGLGDMDIVPELGTGKTDTMIETYQKVIEHCRYSNETVISAEVMQDAKFGSLSKAKGIYAQFAASYSRSQIKMAIAALTGGSLGLTSKTYAYGSKSDYNRCTGDGEAVFSTSHIVKKTGGTACNVFSDAMDTNGALIDYLANAGRNLPNESGEVTGNLFDTIIIPGNRPALERLLKALLFTNKRIGTANNDINTQEGLFDIIVAKHWTATRDCGIMMSSEANKLYSGNMFFNRIGLHINEDLDRYENVTLTSVARWSIGFFDWRHMVAWGVEGGAQLLPD